MNSMNNNAKQTLEVLAELLQMTEMVESKMPKIVVRLANIQPTKVLSVEGHSKLNDFIKFLISSGDTEFAIRAIRTIFLCSKREGIDINLNRLSTFEQFHKLYTNLNGPKYEFIKYPEYTLEEANA